MPKQRKADAAERIAGTVHANLFEWDGTMSEKERAEKQLAARIRRAIRAAVTADRKGRGKR